MKTYRCKEIITEVPLSVGYSFIVTDELKEILYGLGVPRDGVCNEKLKEEIHVAIWFSNHASGMTEDAKKKDEDLQLWLNKKRRLTDIKGIIDNNFYVKKNKMGQATMVTAKIMCLNEPAYLFFFNSNYVATSQIKKAINTGHYSSHGLQKITLENKITVDLKPFGLNKTIKTSKWVLEDVKKED